MVETGWVCACGRTNRGGSCPRCGKIRPVDAQSVPVTGRPGLTKQWFEMKESDVPPSDVQPVEPDNPTGGDATVAVHLAPPSHDAPQASSPTPTGDTIDTIDTSDPALLDYAYPEGVPENVPRPQAQKPPPRRRTAEYAHTMPQGPPPLNAPGVTPPPAPRPVYQPPEARLVHVKVPSPDETLRTAAPADSSLPEWMRATGPAPGTAPAPGQFVPPMAIVAPPAVPPTRSFGAPPAFVPSPVVARRTTWGEDLGFALTEPFGASGTMLIGLSGIFGALVTAVGGLPLGVYVSVALWVGFLNFMNAYWAKIIEVSSAGRYELPDTPAGHELTGRFVQFFSVNLSAFLPCLVVGGAWMFIPEPGAGFYGPIFLGAWLAGILLAPMALLLTTQCSDPMLAFNYPALIASIRKTAPSYMIVFGFSVAVSVATQGAGMLMTAILGAGMGALVGAVLFFAGITYSGMAISLLLGRFYRREQRALGWFPENAEPAAQPAPTASSAPPAAQAPAWQTPTAPSAPPPPSPSGSAPVVSATTGAIFGQAERLTIKDRINQQLNEVSSPRTRAWIGLLIGLVLTGVAVRTEMTHWTARTIFEAEIERGDGNIRECVRAALAGKLGLKVEPRDLQFIASGATASSVECIVTVKCDAEGFYDQATRMVQLTPRRPVVLGFDMEPGRDKVWKIESWRAPSRIIAILVGLGLVAFCGIRLGTGE